MKTKKISLKEIQGALSRAEMKQIMAGSGNPYCDGASCGNWKCADDRLTGLSDCQQATDWCINHGTTGVRCS